MARIGKIARLPQAVREELNRRLADGEVGGSLLRWLNGLPAAREVLAGLFGGAVITKQNLSEWRNGGFREWQTRQELFSDARTLSARAQEIREVAGDKLTDDLATVLAGQYAMVLNRWLARPTQELEARLRVLHGLCRDIVALRREEHNAARLEFNLERWEFDRERMLRQMAAREREQAEGQGESNLVQVKNFHRGAAETRRECEVREDTRERTGVSGDGGRPESKLVQVKNFSEAVGHAGREAVKTGELQARHPFTWLKPGVNEKQEEFCLPPTPVEMSGDGGQGESNLVQPEIFSGAVGYGTQTSVEAGEYSRPTGLLSDMYMFSKEGLSFLVSPGLGWSVGTAHRNGARIRGEEWGAMHGVELNAGTGWRPALRERRRPLSANGALATGERLPQTTAVSSGLERKRFCFPCR